MAIGVKYDDGSGRIGTFSKGLHSPWGAVGRIGKMTRGLVGTRPIRSAGGKKSLIEKLRERREAAEPMAASVNLDRIDPRNGGQKVGDAHSLHPLDADASHRNANGHEPWERSFLSGIHFEKEAPTGRTIVWGYLRSDRFTGEGRAFETTGETKVPVYSFFEPKDPSPAPFDIATNEDFTKSVVRCIFYWGKEEITVPDYSLADIPEEGTATLYLTRTVSEGVPIFALTTDEPEEGDETTDYFKIYDFTDGEVSCDYRTTFLSLGCAGSKFIGDYDGSEEIDGEDEAILVTGHPGEEDSQGHDSHSGLKFLTVGARTDEESGEKIPPKIIARIIDKPEDEDWAAKTMTVTPADGSPKTVHFLGSDDIDIEIPKPVDPPDPLKGSDYIDVPTQGQDAGKILAKVSTPANQQVANTPNALLTHNTDQFVRGKKTFLGLGQDAALKKVVIDGPNGKVEVQNAAGNRIIKLDAADIPAQCGQGGAATIQVRKLTVTHPREKDGKSADIYHVIGCADIDINEGDAIEKIEPGTSTQDNGYTITPVIITLKDGTKLTGLSVKAKNGADGDPGDDGASVTEATAGTPVVSGNTTTTPITFTLSDGTTVGPVDVVSTNGVAASGSDYIEVGDGTGETTKGQVKARIPADGTKGLVTTDTEQTIKGRKTFASGSNQIVIGDGLELYHNTPYVDFHLGKSEDDYTSRIIETSSGLTIIGNSQSGVIINGRSNNKVVLTRSPTVSVSETDSTLKLAVATCGWVNDWYKVTNVKSTDGSVTVTPNATTKEVDLSVDIPDISGKADKATGLTGATKCKITYNSQGIVTGGTDLEASDLPSHSHESDSWFTTAIQAVKTWAEGLFSKLGHTHTKSEITDFPDIPSAPQGEKIWTVDGTSVTVNASAAKTIKSNVKSDWNASSGSDAEILNKPTIPTIPDITATPSGTGNVVTGVTASGHALTVIKGTVKEPSGSDYIEVSSTGVVSAKNLVTTDSNQTITGYKTFENPLGIAFKVTNAWSLMTSGVRFEKDESVGLKMSFENMAKFTIQGGANAAHYIDISTPQNIAGTGITLIAYSNKSKSINLTKVASTDTSSEEIATCGWVNDKYKVTNVKSSDGSVTVMPNATTKEIDLKVEKPTIPDIEVDTSAITSGKAIGGLTVDAANKHKIIASAVDIPAAQIQSDWNQTNSTAKDFIKNKPTIPPALQGSEYIDIPTTGTDAGKVKAKISPTSTDSHALVTTDTAQTIKSSKTVEDRNLNFSTSANGTIGTIRPSDSENGTLVIEAPSKHLRLTAGVNYTVLLNAPNTPATNTTSKSVATVGWVNDKYKVTNIKSSDGSVTVTPNATTKEVDLSVDIPDISGKADKATGLTGATKCKITYNSQGIVTAGADLSASDLPSHTHTKDDITDFPASLKNPHALTIKRTGATDVVYDGSEAKEITIGDASTIPDHDFIADIMYDISDHKFKKLVGHCVGGAITYGENRASTPAQGTWTDMVGGETTPLSGE